MIESFQLLVHILLIANSALACVTVGDILGRFPHLPSSNFQYFLSLISYQSAHTLTNLHTMAFISAQRQMVITYGEPAANCQGTKVSPCEYCGSAGGCGRRVSTCHVVPGEIRNPQAGGDDIKGDHTVGFSDGTRAVIAFPDLRHRCTRFPSPVCGRGRASLIYAGKFNTAPTSHDSYPAPIWTYPDPKHTCTSYPCPHCGNQGYNN